MLLCGQQGAWHYNNIHFPSLTGVELAFEVVFDMVCVNILNVVLNDSHIPEAAAQNDTGRFRCSDCF